MAPQVTEPKSGHRVSADELAAIAHRAQAFTGASGTAIALSEGTAGEIVCQARSGSTAPDIGATLRLEGTFTGLCIQSGKELRCDDAETDTRVDTAAIRTLGIRSMVVIPVREDSRVVGVLAVFAPTAHAFTITHMAVLRTLGDQISALIQKERRERHDEYTPQSLTPFPAASAAKPKPAPVPIPVVAAPVVIKPSAPRPRFTPPPMISKVEPVKPAANEETLAAPLAEDISKPAGREGSHATFHHNFGTLDAAGAPSRASSGPRPVLMIAVAGITAAVVLGWYMFHKRPAQANAAPSANSATTATPASAPAPVPTAASEPVAPASNSASSSEPAASGLAEESPKSARDSKPVIQVPPPTPKPERTVAITGGKAKIRVVRDSAAENAPPLTLGGAAPAGLSNLASPASAVTPSMMTQSELQPVQVLKKVAPVYPLMAKQRNLSGTVVIEATISKEGKLTNLQLVSGPPIFRDAAFDAIKHWQFKPAHLNGQPIEQSTKIRMDFVPR